MARSRTNDHDGLTIIVVPGTLATTLGTTHPEVEEEDYSESDSTNFQKALNDLIKKRANENPTAISWHDEGNVDLATTLSPNLKTKDNIREMLNDMHSVVDALQFLRVRANAGIEKFPVKIKRIEWAQKKETAAHDERQKNNKSDASRLVGGANSEKSRMFGQKKLDAMITECENNNDNYMIIGHSHGGTVAASTIRNRAASNKKLIGFKGAVYVGAPEISSRVRLFNKTLLDNIMSPTIGEALGMIVVVASALVARLIGLILAAQTFPMDSQTQLNLKWLLSEAPVSTVAALAVSILAISGFAGVWLRQNHMNGRARKAEDKLSNLAPQYYVSAPEDEIVNIFEDLSNGLFDDSKEAINKVSDEISTKYKKPFFTGIIAWQAMRAFQKWITYSAWLVFSAVILWSFFALGGNAEVVFLGLKSFGVELSSEQDIRAFLVNQFGDGNYLSLSTWLIPVGALIAGAILTFRNLLGIIKNLADTFERVVTIGLLGLRESKLPRREDLDNERAKLEIRKEPEEVLSIVTSLANARGANLMSHIRDMIIRKDAVRSLRSPETLQLIRELPAATGLVHTSYFRSKLFMIYLAKMVAELSGGYLTFPRENPDKHDDYVRLDEVARLAHERDLETIAVDASTTNYAADLKKSRRFTKPDTASWAQ